MIAFDEKQLNGHAAILGEFGRGGLDRHSVLDGRGAARKQAVGPGSSTMQTRHAPTALRPLR